MQSIKNNMWLIVVCITVAAAFPIWGAISIVISLILGHYLIPILRSLKAGQSIREDGPQTHLVKSGTPTIGGVIFFIHHNYSECTGEKFKSRLFNDFILNIGFWCGRVYR